MAFVQMFRGRSSVIKLAEIWLLALVLFVVGASPAFAQVEVPASARGEGAMQEGEPHVEVRLIYDHKEVKPGDTIRVGVLFNMNKDWHIYWENPGDAGLPTRVEWKSEGLEFGPLQWSAPGLYSESDGEWTTFGYDGEVVLYSDAVVKEGVSGSIDIEADIAYLACKNACVPGDHVLKRSLKVGEQRVRADKSEYGLFDVYSLQVPRAASALGLSVRALEGEPVAAGAGVRKGNAVLEVVACEGPGDDCPEMEVSYEQLEYAFVTTGKSGLTVRVLAVEPHPTVYRGWVLSLETKLLAGATPGGAVDSTRLAGVLRVLDVKQDALIPVSVDTVLQSATAESAPRFEALFQGVSTSDASTSGSSSGESTSLLYVLMMAFLGGMILNLMPCVFPVLAIKVASFTELAHKERSGVIRNGMAYTAGITSSMLTLGLVVVGLRMAGQQVGWGFQFQQPMFLAGLAAVIVLFAMNTFDLFQVTLTPPGKLSDSGKESAGLRRSFGEGILAVVLATPCSAPFLGTAVGFALTASSFSILLIFMVLGLGLAAPFVALTMIPGAAKVLPRPGMWMNYLKSFLGFALLGAGVWLVWLVGRLAGVDAMGRVLVLLGALSMASWIFGVVQFRLWDRAKVLGLVAALAIVGGAGMFALPLERGDAVASNGQSSNEPVEFKTWNQANIDAELAAGRPVFVVFTADWCLTCKMNEKTAVFDSGVLDAIEKYNVAMLKADWTRPDEAIRAELAAHGKGGVPMYLLYTPGQAAAPEVLPEVLTAGMLIERFERAVGH